MTNKKNDAMHKKTLIIGILSLLFFTLCALAYGFFLRDLFTRSETLIGHKSDIKNADLQDGSLALLSREIHEGESRDRELQTRALHDEEVINLLAELETIAKQESMTLETDSLTQKTEGEFTSILITLRARGTYARVSHFLRILESLPYRTHISSVDVGKGSENQNDEWEGVIAFSIRTLESNGDE